jgi:hypothetical protein
VMATLGVGLEGHPRSELGQAFYPVLPLASDIGSVHQRPV